MDLRDLPRLSFCGQTLSVEERSALEIAMRQRRLEEGLVDVRFFGKIIGAEADYLVCYGVDPSEEYPQKRFYACTTKRLSLQAFPELTEEFRAKAAAISGPFKGDPSDLYGDEEDDDGDDGDDGDEDGEGGAAKPKPVKFSELHRLAYVVSEIDAATSVVPRGAYLVTPTHHLEPNRTFSGLSATEASDLRSYLHYREPTALKRKSALERAGMVGDTDFLDPAVEDEPKGCWALRVDSGEGIATLRSLLWPGYFFFHDIESSSFGGAYFGDGIRNDDIAFML